MTAQRAVAKAARWSARSDDAQTTGVAAHVTPGNGAAPSAAADAALGPATDGGYYLLAMRRPKLQLFDNIDWSTARVAEQTRAAAGRTGVSIVDLPPLGDVDTPADLPLLPPIYAPRRIAITGGTGALGGRYLARLLDELPQLHVTALLRPLPPGTAARRPAGWTQLLARHGARVTVIEQDLTDLSLSPAQRERLLEVDALWHFAASTVMHGRVDRAAVWRANDGAVAALLGLLQSTTRPPRLYHVSTAYVCGTSTGRVYEAALPATGFRNEYEASKASAERRVRTAFAGGAPAAGQLRGCILRPSVVLDDTPGDRTKMIELVAAAVLASERANDPLVLRLPDAAALNVVHADWVLAAMQAVAAACEGGETSHNADGRAGDRPRDGDGAAWDVQDRPRDAHGAGGDAAVGSRESHRRPGDVRAREPETRVREAEAQAPGAAARPREAADEPRAAAGRVGRENPTGTQRFGTSAAPQRPGRTTGQDDFNGQTFHLTARSPLHLGTLARQLAAETHPDGAARQTNANDAPTRAAQEIAQRAAAATHRHDSTAAARAPRRRGSPRHPIFPRPGSI